MHRPLLWYSSDVANKRDVRVGRRWRADAERMHAGLGANVGDDRARSLRPRVGSPSAEKCPDRAQERHDAVRWCRLGSTDSAEEPEIVGARALGGSNDEKPIP